LKLGFGWRARHPAEETAILAGIIVLVLGLVAVGYTVARVRAISGPLLLGFFLRAILAVVDVFFYRVPGVFDGLKWHKFAQLNARAGVLPSAEDLQSGQGLYQSIMTWLYWLFGPSRLMIQGINVLFGTLVIYNVWQIAELIWKDSRGSQRAAWLTAVFPSLVLYSAVLLREVAVAYPLSLGVLFVVRWMLDRRAIHIVKAAAALLVAMAFHSGAVGLLFAVAFWVVGSWLKAIITRNMVGFGRKTAAMVLASGAIVFVLVSGYGMDKFSNVDAGDVQSLQTQQDYYTRGRTEYLGDLRADDSVDLAVQSPLRLVYFLFAPFPWMLSSIRDVFGLLDSGLFFWLIWRLFRKRKAVAENPRALVVLAVFGAMALVFALGVSNYGTAMRHRDKMLPLLIGVGATVMVERRATVPGSAPVRRPSLAQQYQIRKARKAFRSNDT